MPNARHPLIRLASTADAPAVAAIYAPYCEQTSVSFETVAPSEGEMARRIANVIAHKPWIVLDDGSGVVGYAYAGAHNERAAYRWAVSTAIYVNGDRWRRGVGRALYTTLFDLLRYAGYFRATAGITLPNAASVGLHEAVGFTQVGVYRRVGYKLGAWHDVAWFDVELQPARPDPPEPVPIAALHPSAEWDAAVSHGVQVYESRRGQR